MSQLYRQNQGQWSTGSAPCELLYRLDDWWHLPLAIWCRLGGMEPIAVLLDTAAEFSLLGGELARALREDLIATGEPDVFYKTRLGRLPCAVRSLRIGIDADDGEDLELDGITVLVSEAWSGPFTLGMRGALEYIRFAVEPSATADGESRIYFAAGG